MYRQPEYTQEPPVAYVSLVRGSTETGKCGDFGVFSGKEQLQQCRFLIRIETKTPTANNAGGGARRTVTRQDDILAKTNMSLLFCFSGNYVPGRIKRPIPDKHYRRYIYSST